MFQKCIFQRKYAGQFVLKLFLFEKFTDLESDLCIFIGIKRCDSGFGGTKSPAAQPLLFILVKKNMVRHHNLCTVGNQKMGYRYASRHKMFDLFFELRDVECNTISDYIGNSFVKNTGWKLVQCKFTILIYDCVSCIGPALKADDNI